jgi:hypothetical protein
MLAGGLNTLGIHPTGGEYAHLSLVNLLDLMEHKEFRRTLDRFRSAGISVEFELHALSYLLPRDLFDSHPEMFRMDENNIRTCTRDMCASSQDALEIVSSRAEKLSTLLPSDTGKYYFWTDDSSTGGYCCPQCQQLSVSDQALIIYQAIARGIRRAHHDAKQCYLAYHATLKAPHSLRPDDAIFLEYAPFRRNPHVPMMEPSCEANAGEGAHLPELLNFFGRKDSRVLEYWIDNSMYSGWKKPPKPLVLDREVISLDASWYCQMGFTEATSFGCFLGEDYEKLYGEPPIVSYGQVLSRK